MHGELSWIWIKLKGWREFAMCSATVDGGAGGLTEEKEEEEEEKGSEAIRGCFGLTVV